MSLADPQVGQLRSLAVSLLSQAIPIPGISQVAKLGIAAGEREAAERGLQLPTAIQFLGATPAGVAVLDLAGIGENVSAGDIQRLSVRLQACQEALRAQGVRVPLGSFSGKQLATVEAGLRFIQARDRSARSVRTIREGDSLLRQAGYQQGYADPGIRQDGIGGPNFRRLQRAVQEVF